jgi:hypothetical protein
MATIHRSKTGAGPWLSTEDTGGGGATAGAARVLGPFPFAFDDVGLNDGIAFYTPTVGDILLDAWIEVTEAFDGTTPLADIGAVNGETGGLFAGDWGPIEVGQQDDLINLNYLGRYQIQDASSHVVGALSAQNSYYDPNNEVETYIRVTPGKFVNADPLKIVVSQDGSKGGTAVGGTAGAGAVYLVVATPSLT